MVYTILKESPHLLDCLLTLDIRFSADKNSLANIIIIPGPRAKLTVCLCTGQCKAKVQKEDNLVKIIDFTNVLIQQTIFSAIFRSDLLVSALPSGGS